MWEFIRKLVLVISIGILVICNIEIGLDNDKTNISIWDFELAVSTQIASALPIPIEIFCYEMTGCSGQASCADGGEYNSFNCQLKCQSGTIIFCVDDDVGEG